MNSFNFSPFAQAFKACALFLAFVVAGCQSGEVSKTMKEARAMHEATHVEAERFHERLVTIQEDVTAMAGQAKDGDALKPHYEAIMAKLDTLHEKYHAWSSNQVLLPGATCSHDHEDGEHHHHDHGTSLDELSDANHLEIQKAIRAELDGLMEELYAIHQ